MSDDELRALEALGWSFVVIAVWYVGRVWLGIGGPP